MREQPADLVVLDLMLPGIDGFEVSRRLRADGDVAIIMLTALGDEADRVVGLERGADDYVTKPFSPRELVLRVDSILRRGGGRGGGAPQPLAAAGPRVEPAPPAAAPPGRELSPASRGGGLL